MSGTWDPGWRTTCMWSTAAAIQRPARSFNGPECGTDEPTGPKPTRRELVADTSSPALRRVAISSTRWPELGVVWLCWSVGGAGGDESGLIGVDHGLDAVA
jgi:hypothetical protein